MLTSLNFTSDSDRYVFGELRQRTGRVDVRFMKILKATVGLNVIGQKARDQGLWCWCKISAQGRNPKKNRDYKNGRDNRFNNDSECKNIRGVGGRILLWRKEQSSKKAEPGTNVSES